EEGRTRLMEALGCSYAELERSGWALVVRKAALRSRPPARYDDELLVRTWIERVGGASLTFAYSVHAASDQRLLSDGTTELACVDLRKPERRPAMLPDDLRELLER